MSLRRGIEPIIATVILVAVALIIAVAVVGYLMGLFGGLAGGQPQISITSVSVKLKTGATVDLDMYVNNAGAGSDRLLRIEILYAGRTFSIPVKGECQINQECALIQDDGGVTIPGNYRGWLKAADIALANTNPAIGDALVLKLYFEKSGTQTINTVLNPG